MGALLAELNDEVDAIAHEDHDEAQRAYDKVEARLAAERIREEDDAEEDDACGPIGLRYETPEIDERLRIGPGHVPLPFLPRGASRESAGRGWRCDG